MLPWSSPGGWDRGYSRTSWSAGCTPATHTQTKKEKENGTKQKNGQSRKEKREEKKSTLDKKKNKIVVPLPLSPPISLPSSPHSCLLRLAFPVVVLFCHFTILRQKQKTKSGYIFGRTLSRSIKIKSKTCIRVSPVNHLTVS